MHQEDSNLEHVNSKINLIVHKTSNNSINKNLIQIKVENLNLLNSSDKTSFRNQISIPISFRKNDDSTILRSQTCNLKFEFTIKSQIKKKKLSSKEIFKLFKMTTY